MPDPSNYVSRLRASVQHIHPVSPHLTQSQGKVVEGLSTATHVFLQHDAVRKPLQPPYDGPYQVLKRTNKHFTLSIKGRHDTVSVDHLKPAHLDHDPPHITPPIATSTTTPRTTRSGRHVHFPKYLSSFV